MSGDGYAVDPQTLQQAAKGIEEVIETLKPLGIGGSADEGRGFSGLELSGMQLGSAALKSALDGFCERWSWGVRSLVQDGNEVAKRLGLSAGAYYDQEQYLVGTLKDVANAAIGNPHASSGQVEKESWSQMAAGDRPDYSAKSFQDSWQHTGKVWSGETEDLKELGVKAALPGVGEALVDSGEDKKLPGMGG